MNSNFQLRYQKCLDAHPQGLERTNSNLNTPGKSIGAALKSIVGSLTGRKTNKTTSDSWDTVKSLQVKTFFCLFNNLIKLLSIVVKELCLLPVEREVIRHRHLQSPLTQKFFTCSSIDLHCLASMPSPTSFDLKSLHNFTNNWDSINWINYYYLLYY